MSIVRLRYDQVATPGPTPGTLVVQGTCQVTGRPHRLTVDAEGLARWAGGTNIQIALPSLPPEQREFLISGTSPAGWARLFGAERTVAWEKESCGEATVHNQEGA